jgi:hypothetical protein
MSTVAMSEEVLGLTVNEVVAYAAIANVGLALVLTAITGYYARHAKRQADANREQVAASNRQGDSAQKTLDLLLAEKQQQRRIDISTVLFQLTAAIDMIDDWLERIHSESYNLPDVIEIRPTNFNSTIPNAERIDQIVAGYIGAALLFITKAETDIQVMRDKNPSQYADTSMGMMAQVAETREQFRARAGKNLNVARFKLDSAKTRLEAITEDQQQGTLPD